MRIIVTGGTGFIGKKLIYQLFAEGHDLVVVTRNKKRAQEAIDLPITFVESTPGQLNIDFPQGEYDGVINLAGEGIANKRWTQNVKDELIRSRINESEKLINSIKRVQKQKLKFAITASAIGIYQPNTSTDCDEYSPNGNDFLAELVSRWENTWTEQTIAERLVLLRIGVVLGRGGGALEKLKTVFQWGVGGRVGSGKQPFSWIHVDDLLRVVDQAIKDPKYTGVINCVSPKPVTNAELTTELAKTLGRWAIFPVPSLVLKTMLGEMATLALDGQRVIPKRLENLGFQFQFSDLRSALMQLYGKKSIGKNGEAYQCEVFETVQFLDKPIEEVFKFFADPYNLEKITPPLLKFKITNIECGENCGVGTKIDYRLKIHRVPVKWRTLIAEWETNKHFVDMQLKGPYKIWHHKHSFESVQGGTLMRDRVFYKIPLGILGNQLLGAFIRRDVNEIFSFRRQYIKGIMGGSKPESQLHRELHGTASFGLAQKVAKSRD